MDKFCKESLRTSVTKIREILEDKGLKIYDEGRDRICDFESEETVRLLLIGNAW